MPAPAQSAQHSRRSTQQSNVFQRTRVRSQRHRVVILVTQGVPPFELGVACEVFGLERPEIADPWPYTVTLASPDAPPLRTNVGFAVIDVEPLRALDRADTIVIPAWPGTAHRVPDDATVAALRRAHKRGARLLSVCSGAFLLAHAGLLDGRRATTHWMYTDELTSHFPAVAVDPHVLYVDEGTVLTSAGTAAGIDLCLHVVRADQGADFANAVARRMVVPPHRDGGQAQFVAAPVQESCDVDSVAATLDWALARLDEPLTVEALARQSLMSPRTFARRFRAATGTTPLQWLLRQRILLAQQLLERSDVAIEVIATRCGFGSAAALRTHFRRFVGTSPLAYRRTFRCDEEGAA
jgi:transcriptional regulator GlxA family with amidase domain